MRGTEHVQENGKRGECMKFDMHCHTKEGSLDGKVMIEEYIRQLKRMAAGLEAAINGLERSMDRFREDEEAGHG